MPEASLTAGSLGRVRIALAGDSAAQRRFLEQALGGAGADVVLSGPPGAGFLRDLDHTAPEVLILDLDPQAEHSAHFVEALLQRSELPVVFNDVAALSLHARHQARWFETLLEKLARLTGRELAAAPAAPQGARSVPTGAVAERVWVLGASLGGPQAVKRFLAALPADIPAAFVLAQHLGANFIGLLAEQLNRSTALRVQVPEPGRTLRHGEVVLAPVDQRLMINPLGALELRAPMRTSPYRPCIDEVIEDVTRRYGARAGAIVFSGMGQDGQQGCRALAARGGTVWAQNAESCIISSMPDSARAAGVVSFSGTPEALARGLAEFLQRHSHRGGP